ncbi:FAD:protein FMN transferase [Marinobacteraceae bacterium S3BR75-40.1]
MKTSTEHLHLYNVNGATMGTRYTARFYGAENLDTTAIEATLFAAVDQVDRQMSSWKSDSELMRLNAAPVDTWQNVPQELHQVLEAGLAVESASGGAFDMAVGDLVNAWGFGAACQEPEAASIKRLMQGAHTPASRALELDTGRVRKHAPITLDLAGIAKGFGVDQLARCLDGFGIDRYLVGIDGEMRARGLKPDGEPWDIAVERPERGLRSVMGVLALTDAAVATSGDYRHCVTVGRDCLSHTMHGASRGPVRNHLAQVTVVMADCMQADAWATALMAAGETTGPALAQQQGLNALFILREASGLREIAVGSLF